MKIHHLRKSIELGQIETILIETDDMLADIFTKHCRASDTNTCGV